MLQRVWASWNCHVHQTWVKTSDAKYDRHNWNTSLIQPVKRFHGIFLAYSGGSSITDACKKHMLILCILKSIKTHNWMESSPDLVNWLLVQNLYQKDPWVRVITKNCICILVDSMICIWTLFLSILAGWKEGERGLRLSAWLHTSTTNQCLTY